MATIFDKIRNIVLGNVHELLDRKIDKNSPASIKQHIRDLEAAIEEIESDAAVAQGSMKTASNNMKLTSSRMEELQENINFILNDGIDSNDHLANPLVKKLIAQEEILNTQQVVFVQHQSTMAKLDEVVAQLRTTHVKMLTDVASLEAKANSSSAVSKAADTVNNATKLSGNMPSVDNVAERLDRQANIADAQLERALGNFQNQTADPILDAKVAARLAAMKNKIQSSQ